MYTCSAWTNARTRSSDRNNKNFFLSSPPFVHQLSVSPDGSSFLSTLVSRLRAGSFLLDRVLSTASYSPFCRYVRSSEDDNSSFLRFLFAVSKSSCLFLSRIHPPDLLRINSAHETPWLVSRTNKGLWNLEPETRDLQHGGQNTNL